MTEEYNGDVILIEKLIEFLSEEHWEWDDEGKYFNAPIVCVEEVVNEI